jgi:hypothetical protein
VIHENGAQSKHARPNYSGADGKHGRNGNQGSRGLGAGDDGGDGEGSCICILLLSVPVHAFSSRSSVGSNLTFANVVVSV